ncbi:hypothetical protein [Nostoc sp. C117]
MTELFEQTMSGRKPLCIYAKLKTLSASEQDAIIAIVVKYLEDK